MNKIQLDAVLRLVNVQINPKVFQKISRSVAGIPKSLNQTQKSMKGVTQQSNRAANSIGKVKAQLTGSQRAAKLFLQRMAQFAILLPTFATLNRILQGGVGFLFEFDSKLRDIVRIDIGGLENRMNEIAMASLNTAKAFGVSATEVLDTTRVFKQAGLDIESSQERARLAILATQVSTLDAGQATEFLIAATQQFNLEGQDLTDSLDALIKAEDLAAVNASDIADAFRTGGNALATFSKDINASIGLIAALREQSRKSGREIGTFFKTLQTRIFAAGESRSAVEALGVTVENLDGTLRPTLDVLNDLKIAFDGLTEAQAANAAKAIAGVRQFESLVGTLNSLERANSLAADASNARGTAEEKERITGEKLERQLGKLTASGQELALAIGASGLDEFLESTLKFATVLTEGLTKLVSTADALGASILPLLALSGVKIGGAIFGATGGAAGGAKSQNTNSFRANTQAVAASTKVYTKNVGAVSAQNKGLKDAAIRFAVLTAAATVAASAIEGLGKATDTNLGSASAAVQTGLQFGIISKKAGIVAGAFAAITASILISKEAIDARVESDRNAAKAERAEGEIRKATESLGGGAGGLLVQFIQDQVKGLEKQDINLGQILTKVLSDSPSLKVTFPRTGIEGLKAVLGSTKGISQLAKQDESLFANKEAFKELQDSFDETGRSSFTLRKQQDLLFTAMGATANAVNELSGELERNLIPNLAQFEKLQGIVDFIENIRNLNSQLSNARTLTPLEGIDVIRSQSDDIREAFKAIIRSVQDSRQELVSRAGEFGLDSNDAANIFSKVRQLANKEGDKASADLDAFIKSLLPQSAKFAKKVAALEKEGKEAEIQQLVAAQSIRKALADETLKITTAETQALRDANAAADAFTVSLTKIGGGIGENEAKLISSLGSQDIASVLAGTSDLPSIIQDFLTTTIGDGVADAEAALAGTTEATNLSIMRLSEELSDIDSKIEALGSTTAGTTDDFKKQALEIERSGKFTEIETAKREGLISSVEGVIKLTEAQTQANEDAAKAEAKRKKNLEKLAQSSQDLDNAFRNLNIEFAEFAKGKLDELIGDENDARSDLKDTQQEVLDSTASLDDAYSEFARTILEVNGALATAQVTANLLGRDIDMLNGDITTFDQRLNSLDAAFNSVLKDANITLEQRIQLERELATETLQFLEQAKQEITGAGIGIFGQSTGENQALSEGIAGLNFVAEQLGGSFENFLGLGDADFAAVSDQLLSLPAEVRQGLLDALSFLPSSVSIGGFSTEQLEQALGQVGAGVAADEGLPSIEDLNNQQVEQLNRLQDLALQDAQLQLGQLAAAQEQLDAAEAQLEASKIQQERATEDLQDVRVAVIEQKGLLDQANTERRELLNAVLTADDNNTLRQIEQRSSLFSEQNAVFREIGNNITTAIGARTSVLDAAAAVGGAYKGHIPNAARGRGKLSASEVFGLINAASREKSAVPGAGLVVANDTEMIIPTKNAARGHIPNAQNGFQLGPIAAGIDAVKSINETVVAAIARSVTQALSDIGGGGPANDEQLEVVAALLRDIQSELQTVSESNSAIESNTSVNEAEGGNVGAVGGGQDVNITVQTNQNNTITVTGLDNLVESVREAVRDAASDQADAQIEPVLEQLESVVQVLRERNLVSSFGQPGS